MNATAAPATRQKLPSLRHHKASGQGFVVLSGRTIYCGKFNLPETQQRYLQVVAEWVAAGRQLPTPPEELTVDELIARFWVHAQQYYVDPDGAPTNELHNLKMAFRQLRAIYGGSKAIEFGPLALKAVRQRMIEIGWCRLSINKMVSRIKLLFRWAVEQEYLPGTNHHALQAVAGLRFGRSAAKESKPVKPVPQEHIDAVRPFVTRQVWTMIQVQLLTAARPGEIILMRPCDINRSGPVWVYTPSRHKTMHHGHERLIHIGPQCQEILAPFLLRPQDAYLFSPREAMEERRALAHLHRKTPMSCGNRPGTNRRQKPRKLAGQRYTVCSYERAIREACRKAFRPEGMTEADLKAWRCPQHWHPHQLRHNAATEIRRQFGLETSRIILGHRSAAITQIYAEEDRSKAVSVMAQVG